MGKVIRLTESDLVRIVKKTIKEMEGSSEKLNPDGFKFLGEKGGNEYYGQQHRGFGIVLIISPKQTSEYEDFFNVKCLVQLPGGEFLDIGQEEFGKSVYKISDSNDVMLKKLIRSAENLGKFRVGWDNTPRL